MKRAIAVAVSLLLAAGGTFLLVRYVQGAEDRALEGEELVNVLVVDDLIRRGSPVEDITGRVKVEQVPAKVAAQGVVTQLEAITGIFSRMASSLAKEKPSQREGIISMEHPASTSR